MGQVDHGERQRDRNETAPELRRRLTEPEEPELPLFQRPAPPSTSIT